MILPNDSIIEIDGEIYSILHDGINTRILFLFSNNEKKINVQEMIELMIETGISPFHEPTNNEIDYILDLLKVYNEIQDR